ncbi:hypothetical protein [Salipiger mangrovisoli]|uniref:Type IV pilus biogenesis protein PilP n=1 Tax=Salipiger mangrovisoli TaxID=2865933 RepID=A0ABR9X6F9_9RHOB|nr:hypothetical protein [Salipiger mangrovisoli]MBE9639117.1 hypothetical protein [Salipiger mangrovisoli]
MTPDFALSLSSDGLTLLRRKASGWLPLAEADLSADGFDAIRETALAEDSSGAQVALFLPNDQVRYIELPDPGSESERRAALEAALDGATPYPVRDLVLDWSLSGTTLLGAAVARESLEEAESYLRERGFEPVYFAAIPPSGTFRGTAYFGPAESWQGPQPERPGKVTLLEPDAVADRPAASVSDPAPLPAATEPAAPKAETPSADVSADADPLGIAASVPADRRAPPPEPSRESPPKPEAAPDLPAETPAQPSPDLGTSSEAAAPVSPPVQSPVQPPLQPPVQPPVAASRFPEAPEPVPVPPTVSAPTDHPTAPSFSSIRASRAPAPAAPAAAPRLSMGRDTAPSTSLPPVAEGSSDAASSAPEPQAAKRRPFGFAKRREDAEPPARSEKAPVRMPPEPATGSATTQGIKQVTPRPPVSHPLDPAGSAPVSGPSRVAALRQEAGRGASSLTPEEERERLTVFGAREGQKVVGGKPRFLGLILTVLLLLFLAAVAAFSSVFLGDQISRLFAPAPTENVALDTTEDSAEAIPAPEEEFDEEGADGELAALDLPPPASEGFEDMPAPQPSGRISMSADEAATAYAVSGIWQRAPSAPARPPQTSAEDVYVASIDPEVQQFDAVALPDLDAGPREDITLEPVRLPPGPGVRFDLDARGLVKATPEGNVSPDGVRIFTGLPPQVPPLRDPAPAATPEPEVSPDVPPAAEAETDSTDETADPSAQTAEPESTVPAEEPGLADFRPRGRPGDLIEQTERAVLGGVSLAELEAMRPQMRPLTAQEEALALDLPVTDQAIGASLTPLPRPRSMEAIVQEAVKQASNTPAVTSSAPVALAPGPSIPQNASVAKSATLSNQIDLREISLIGIYGKDSSRRALVRLPSGKYQKVQVGDNIDGGRIAAISDDELRYVKSGRNVVLKMPRS